MNKIKYYTEIKYTKMQEIEKEEKKIDKPKRTFFMKLRLTMKYPRVLYHY